MKQIPHVILESDCANSQGQSVAMCNVTMWVENVATLPEPCHWSLLQPWQRWLRHCCPAHKYEKHYFSKHTEIKYHAKIKYKRKHYFIISSVSFYLSFKIFTYKLKNIINILEFFLNLSKYS